MGDTYQKLIANTLAKVLSLANLWRMCAHFIQINNCIRNGVSIYV
jgi:hypothetical protein